VYDYELVWTSAGGFSDHEFCFVMLLNKCTWKKNVTTFQSQVLPYNKLTVFIKLCKLAIDVVDKEGLVVFVLAKRKIIPKGMCGMSW
jgi:hypothetical protein